MVTTLREARLSDNKAIAQLHAKSWQQHYRGIFSDHYLDHEVNTDLLETWYSRLKSPVQNQIIILAIQDEVIAGFCCFFLDDDPHFGTLLDNLHVSAHLHKSGIGKRLINACAQKINEQARMKKMYLWVFEQNTNARNVYAHLGGIHFETVLKENPDGTKASCCRYLWEELSGLLKT